MELIRSYWWKCNTKILKSHVNMWFQYDLNKRIHTYTSLNTCPIANSSLCTCVLVIIIFFFLYFFFISLSSRFVWHQYFCYKFCMIFFFSLSLSAPFLLYYGWFESQIFVREILLFFGVSISTYYYLLFIAFILMRLCPHNKYEQLLCVCMQCIVCNVHRKTLQNYTKEINLYSLSKLAASCSSKIIRYFLLFVSHNFPFMINI